MGLSEQLVAEFVKSMNDSDNNKSTETTVFATTVEYDGRIYVRIDGSDLLTPVSKTAEAEPGERVTVMIKDHTALITGNLDAPAARNETVKEQGSKISEFEIIMAYKVTAKDLEAVNAAIENLKATTAKIKDAEIVQAEIENLQAKFATLDHVTITDMNAITAYIESIEAKFGEFTDISTEDLEALNAEITNLKGYTANFTYVTADVLEAMQASIRTLTTEKLSAKEADLKYATIDFTNIEEAAVKKIFADYGVIKELVIGEGTVVKELIGVTIKGDLIEGNTIKADKLVVKGSDGLYYKLNFESGNFTDAEEVPTDGLHGDVIIANTITAEKINVDDLVAFGATIAGFHIVGRDEEHEVGAIYSGTKESVDNTTPGSYLDDEGQVAFGDGDRFLKFYKDEETGEYKLVVSADTFVFGSSGLDVETELSNVSSDASAAQASSNEASLKISDIKNILHQMITDENGQSLMVVTEKSYTITDEVLDALDGELLSGVTTTTGENVYRVISEDGSEIYYSIVDSVYYKVIYNPETCTFNISDIEAAISNTNSTVNTLSGKVDDVDNIVDQIQKTVIDLAVIGGYVVIDKEMEVTNSDGTTETVPAIILGESDSDFKVIITNKQIAFCEGSTTPAYISGQTLIAQKIDIKVELAQSAPDNSGQFVWKVRQNGNYGLSWKGVSS